MVDKQVHSVSNLQATCRYIGASWPTDQKHALQALQKDARVLNKNVLDFLKHNQSGIPQHF